MNKIKNAFGWMAKNYGSKKVTVLELIIYFVVLSWSLVPYVLIFRWVTYLLIDFGKWLLDTLATLSKKFHDL
jgi:hypothetical protein